jgi:hypothetical protein
MSKRAKIAGNTFLFTGTLTEFTRDEAEALVEANGGKVLSGVSAKLNYLVIGEDPGSKLEKAKALGTVKILSEKDFMKILPKGDTTSFISAKSQKPSATSLDRNEILLKIKLPEIKKIFKKYSSSDVTDKLIQVLPSIQSFSDLSSENESIFYFSESDGKLIMNYIVKDEYDLYNLCEDLFVDLAKHASSDFKVVFLN